MPSYTTEVHLDFPEVGRSAEPGDTVDVDDDGVLVDIVTPQGSKAPEPAPEPVAEPTPDAPEES